MVEGQFVLIRLHIRNLALLIKNFVYNTQVNIVSTRNNIFPRVEYVLIKLVRCSQVDGCLGFEIHRLQYNVLIESFSLRKRAIWTLKFQV